VWFVPRNLISKRVKSILCCLPATFLKKVDQKHPPTAWIMQKPTIQRFQVQIAFGNIFYPQNVKVINILGNTRYLNLWWWDRKGLYYHA
jgi:hypothetical protein